MTSDNENRNPEMPIASAKKRELEIRDQLIRDSLEQGVQLPDIAKRVRMGLPALRQLLVETENLTITRSQRYKQRRDMRAIGRLGSAFPAIIAQGPEFQQWIKDSLPEGVSILEFFVSIAVDSYLEETSPEAGQPASTNPEKGTKT